MRLFVIRHLFAKLGVSAINIQRNQIHFQRRFIGTCVNLHSSNNTNRSHEDEDYNIDEDPTKGRNGRRETQLSTQTFFDSKEKNKKTFNSMLELYKQRFEKRRGHVEFILAAMKHLEEYGVQYDIQTYKNIITIMPEGKYVPENMLQSEFVHFPQQQYCIVELLDYMETKGICPDVEMLTLLKKRFGKEGHPVRKCGRMIYWMSKMKNASPWPIPIPPPSETFLLAQMAIERIVSVDPQSKVTVYQTDTLEEAIDHTYVVSGQSPTQRKLIKKHPKDKPLYVEGRFRIWLRTANITYFILRADNEYKEPEPPNTDDFENMQSPLFLHKQPNKQLIERPSVHEQEDGTILAVCATGTSSRDSILSWIRLLEKDGNPDLAEIPVLFTLKSPLGDVIPLNDDEPGAQPSRGSREQVELKNLGSE